VRGVAALPRCRGKSREARRPRRLCGGPQHRLERREHRGDPVANRRFLRREPRGRRAVHDLTLRHAPGDADPGRTRRRPLRAAAHCPRWTRDRDRVQRAGADRAGARARDRRPGADRGRNGPRLHRRQRVRARVRRIAVRAGPLRWSGARGGRPGACGRLPARRVARLAGAVLDGARGGRGRARRAGRRAT
jgi:hypothetical protein